MEAGAGGSIFSNARTRIRGAFLCVFRFDTSCVKLQ